MIVISDCKRYRDGEGLQQIRVAAECNFIDPNLIKWQLQKVGNLYPLGSLYGANRNPALNSANQLFNGRARIVFFINQLCSGRKSEADRKHSRKHLQIEPNHTPARSITHRNPYGKMMDN